MNQQKITRPEAAILYLIFGLLIFGIVMSRLDRFWFEFVYTVEDGFIEWMTVVPLLTIVGLCAYRLYHLYRYRRFAFLLSVLGLLLFSFFAAGEELSWGQRYFNLESSDFFKAHNSQKETNLHNLVISGKSINLIVFSRLLIVLMAGYLIVLPILYHKKPQVKAWINSLAVPIPKVYQIIAFLLVFSLISFCPSGKRAELLEFSSCFLALLIVAYPQNPEIFKVSQKS